MLWVVQTVPSITGTGDCPEPAVVSQKLAALLPSAASAHASGAKGPSPRVHLSRASGGELAILLLGADGRQLDERRLRATAGCDDLAAAVAVVAATWASDPEPTTPARVELPGSPVPPTARNEPASAVVDARSSSVAASPPRRSSTTNLRLGAVASSAGEQWAAGLRVAGGIRVWGDRWALGAVVAGTLPHSVSVGDVPGAARWMRGYVGVGPELTLLSGPVDLKAHLQAVLGLLHVTGNGLAMPTSDTSFRLGTTAGLWSAWRGWHGLWPWLAADLVFWPGRERLLITGVAAEGTVPSLEGQVAAGVGIDLFP